MVVFTASTICIRFVRTSYVLPLVIVMGVIASFIPAAIVTIVAQLMHEGRVSALALSMVTIGQNTGILLGPTLFGLVMESVGGWTLAYTMFVPVGLLGIGAAMLLGRRGRRPYGA
jgi:predicted MFS family arabinose efflux permease